MRGIEQIPWLYDAICAFVEWRGLARWRRWIVDGARGRTLDLGCGTGRNLPIFPTTVRAVGLDPSFEALRRARRRAPATPLVQGSAEALPFRDGCFDTVVSGLVLCSVPDPAIGLAEVRRVLRPEGTLRALEHVRAHDRVAGPAAGRAAAGLDVARGRLSSQPRHGARGRGGRLRDRRRRPARAGQPPPLRGPAPRRAYNAVVSPRGPAEPDLSQYGFAGSPRRAGGRPASARTTISSGASA